MTAIRPTLREAVDFVQAHGKLGPEWNRKDITNAIMDAVNQKAFSWSVDVYGNFSGMVVCRVIDKEVHVIIAIIRDSKLFKHHLKIFREQFPGYKLTGTRRGKEVDFTSKLSLIAKL